MSKLSCNQFVSGDYEISIIRRRNAVEIVFNQKPAKVASTEASVYTSNTLTINANQFNAGQQIYIRDGVAHEARSSSTGISDPSRMYRIYGYRFFMLNGFLKCVKREVSDSYAYYVTTASSVTTIQQPPNKRARDQFCHPAAALDSVNYTEECLVAIKDAVLDLALQHDVKVPAKFHVHGKHHNSLRIQQYLAILDWLAFPLVREIDNPVMCKNTVHADRNFMAPKFKPMNFKQLVEHFYCTSTSKLLEELWKVITVGGDYKRTMFANEEIMVQALTYDNNHELLEKHDNYVIQTGNRHLQTYVFTFGPAILQTMGFDYLYQIAPSFGVSHNRAFEEWDMGSSVAIQQDLKIILKHVTPKKLLSTLFEPNKKPDVHSLKDTARMMRHYETRESIPAQLRSQYPNGLGVDFKFKTLKELHDKISTQYTIIKTESERKPIAVSDVYSKLHGRMRDGLRLVVPDNTSTLAVWGKLLNICIASYGDRAADQTTLLLGVEKEDRIKYCIEFGTCWIDKPVSDEQLPGLYLEGGLPRMIEGKTAKEAYPRLKEKHVGVTPDDVPDEDAVYHVPSIVQFRSERNGDPSKEDRNSVEHMLIEWVKENFEFLRDIKGIFDSKDSIANFFNNPDFVNQIMNQQGRPDQLIVNPAQYDALMRINDRENRFIPNPAMPADRAIIWGANDALPVIINNVAPA